MLSIRYPTQLEKALQGYLENLREQGEEEIAEDDQSEVLAWVMEFVSVALSRVRSQVRHLVPILVCSAGF